MAEPNEQNEQQPAQAPVPDIGPQNRLRPGEVFDAYIVERFLGRGGMGEVYEVRHRTLDSRYAIKILPPSFAKRQDALDRFQNEARIMSRLNHPHIVRVDDFRLTEGLYWLRMELAQGDPAGAVTLQELADRNGGVIPQSQLLILMRDVIDGVAYAHSLGVVHRDLKPANILLFPGTDGRLHAKVSDYGLVKMMGEEYHRSQVTSVISLSQTGSNPAESEEDTFNRALIGTWEYMSPEQQEAGDVDPRSDVYTLGLMMYRLLTGRKLSPWPPSHYDTAISRNLDVFVLRALEPEAADRYENAGRMLEVFDEFFTRSPEEFSWSDPLQPTAPARTRSDRTRESTQSQPVIPEVPSIPVEDGMVASQNDETGKRSAASVSESGPGSGAASSREFHAGRIGVDLEKARALAAEGNWDDAEAVLTALKNFNPGASEIDAELQRLQAKHHEQHVLELQQAAIANASRMAKRSMLGVLGVIVLIIVLGTILLVGLKGKEEILNWFPFLDSIRGIPVATTVATPVATPFETPVASGTPAFQGGMAPATAAPAGSDTTPPVTVDGTPYPGQDTAAHPEMTPEQTGTSVAEPSGPAVDETGTDEAAAETADTAAMEPQPATAITPGQTPETDSGSESSPAPALEPASTPEPTVMRISGEPPEKPPVPTVKTPAPERATPTAAEQGLIPDSGIQPEPTPAPARYDRFSAGARTIPDLGMELISVRGGGFLMGSDGEGAVERPLHYVKITQPFWIGRREVTLAEYRKFMMETGNSNGIRWSDSRCPYQSGESYPITGFKLGQVDTQPVVLVTWFGARDFCDWLTRREREAGRLPPGYRYRLPTEAEWEYASRAGSATRYPWGDEWQCGLGMAENDAGSNENRCSGFYRSRRLPVNATAPAGSFPPNAWGLFDTSGNVWEWCHDWFDSGYYGQSPKDNPPGPATGTERVIRGGSWINAAAKCTSSFRGGSDPSAAHASIGFRVVLGAEP